MVLKSTPTGNRYFLPLALTWKCIFFFRKLNDKSTKSSRFELKYLEREGKFRIAIFSIYQIVFYDLNFKWNAVWMQRGPCNVVGYKTNILNEIHFRYQFVEIVGDSKLCIDSNLCFQWLRQDFSWIEFLWKLPPK